MDRLAAYATFVAVAERSSFSAAARATGQSAVSVTRQIAALEAHLGLRLFHRSTRAVTLTDAGAVMLNHARAIVSDVSVAEAAVRGAQAVPQGQLYITAPVTFGRLHVLPVVEMLLRDHPALTIRLMLVDRNVRIVEEGIDVAIRIGPLADSSLHAVRIGSVEQRIVASPAYLARNGVPQQPCDLTAHMIIGNSGPRAASAWQFGPSAVEVEPRLLVNTVDSAIAAAEAGMGIANLLSYQVSDAIDAGRLIALFADAPVDRLPVSLLFADRQRAGAACRLFIDAMRDRAAVHGW